MIDFWRAARNFQKGDTVQKWFLEPGVSALSPFVGQVLAVHRGLGFCDVQFPYGTERVSAEELIQVDPKITGILPPALDLTRTTYDTERAREKWASTSRWASEKLPPTFYKDLSAQWGKGASEMDAYDNLWHAHQAAADSVLKDEIQKFYRLASKLPDLRLSNHIQKTATYWVAQGRQYRVTSEEIQAKRPQCPKCGTKMKRTTYKMEKGARHRLFACPKDLFLIKSEAILGPLGEPLGW